MGKASIILLTLALLPLAVSTAGAAPIARACVPNGTCFLVGNDDGAYIFDCHPRATSCAAWIVVAGDHTADVFVAQDADNRVIVDAAGDGASATLTRTRSSTNVDGAAAASASHAYARFAGNWIDVDASGPAPAASSHLCFVANVDGTLVGVACGDWVNGEVTPVFVDRTGETVNEIRNDPLVRCVLTRQCIL